MYLNCLGVGIEKCLEKYYPNVFTIYYIKNFKIIIDNKNQKLPSQEVAILKKADYLVFQPLSEEKYGELSTDYILREILKKSCICISLAYIYFNGYWPDGISYHGSCSLSYGHANVKDIENVNDIYETLRDPHFIKQDVLGQAQFSIDTLQKKEELCDIRVSGDVQSNFRTCQLFWTLNHPSNFLFQIILDRLLPCLGLKQVNIDNDNEYLLNNKLDPIMPIYSQIRDTLALSFTPRRGRIEGQDLDDDDYYTKYYQIIHQK